MSARTRLHPVLRRLRALAAALVLVATATVIQATPVPVPAPLRDALGTPRAEASWCATFPNFTGRLTGSSSSTTALSRTKSGIVYSYISSVARTWSCTAYYRYSGLAWNTAASTGSFDWGDLIDSTSIACNWVVGSTDYLKANGTANCPSTDAQYAMSSSLAQGTYQRDVAHDSAGDFSYVHSSCGTYYQGSKSQRTGQSFSTSNTGNRPGGGANCDPIVLDDTATAQTVVIDSTAPTLSFAQPTGAGFVAAGAYDVKVSVTEAVSGFAGSKNVSLQQYRMVYNSQTHACDGTTLTSDGPAATSTSTGTVTFSRNLVAGFCYYWTADATDQNGNKATQQTSATVKVIASPPGADFTSPDEGTTAVVNAASYVVKWGETGSVGEITGRSLQRRVATWSGSACGAYANDGSPVTTAGPITSSSLVTGKCYQWVQTLTTGAGSSAPVTSGTVRRDSTAPSADFTSPDEATTTWLNTERGMYNVGWTDSAGSGSITSRSLQRQQGAIVNGTCSGVAWANVGELPYTGLSPFTVRPPAFLSGYCVRWQQTIANSVPKTNILTSGYVAVDSGAPIGTIASPLANSPQPDASSPSPGVVRVTGTASDALSFRDYVLQYGQGLSPSSWTTIGTYTTPVASTGTLGDWPTAGLSGVYTVRLTVEDKAGNTVSATRTVVLDGSGRGEEAYRTRVPYDVGGGWILDVGVANGEARLTRDLFTIPSYGPPQELSVAYTSLEAGVAGMFGTGWTSNLTQYLTFDVPGAIITWHRGDGGLVPFGNVSGAWTALAGHYETLAVAGSEVTITAKDQTQYVFEGSGAGRLKRNVNRFGKALTLAWTSSGATATDASGRATTLTIDAAHSRVTQVADSAGRTWAFGYDAAGNLTSIAEPDPDGAGPLTPTTAIDYTAQQLKVTRTRVRAAGGSESIVWTVGFTGGRVTTVRDPIAGPTGPASTLAYDAGMGTTTVNALNDYTAGTADTTVYSLDGQGRVTRLTDAEGYPSSYEYDANSNVTKLTRHVDDGTPVETRSAYDGNGNPTRTDEEQYLDDQGTPTWLVTKYTYNTANDLTSSWQATGDADTAITPVQLVTLYTYSGGHLSSMDEGCTSSGTSMATFAAGCTGGGTQDSATNLLTAYSYTANGQLDTETDPAGRVTKHIYDAYGNETRTVLNYHDGVSSAPDDDVATSFAYDEGSTPDIGLVTTETDPLGHSTSRTYDILGRQLSEVLPGDASIPALAHTWTYDEFGSVLTDEESWTGRTRTTTHVYDPAGRETSATDLTGAATTTEYDAAGNATSQSSGGSTTARTFDGLGRVKTATVDGVTTETTYDGLGDAVGTSKAATITSATFDFAPRVLAATTGDGASLEVTINHAYDLLGHETKTTDPNGVVSRTAYDRLGRVCRSVPVSTMTDAAWAALPDRCTSGVPDPATTSAYDRGGNETTSTGVDGRSTRTTLDALDRPTRSVVNYVDGVYDPAHPDEDLVTVTAYDAAGNTLATSSPAGAVTRYTLNVRGLVSEQLSACVNNPPINPFSDPAACTGTGGATGGQNIRTTTTYDGTGDTISATAWQADGTGVTSTATRDAAGRTTSEVVDAGTGKLNLTTRYAYDTDGRQVAVMDPRGTVTGTLYTGGRMTGIIVNCTTDTSNPQPPLPGGSWWTCAGSTLMDGTWNVTTALTYDSAGNRRGETAPNGRINQNTYDAAGRPATQIEDADGTGLATTHFYDDAGHEVATQSPTVDGSHFSTSRRVYDAQGRVSRQIANCVGGGGTGPADCGGADGGSVGVQTYDQNVVTDYKYDVAGNLVKVTASDPSAPANVMGTVVTRYGYDAAGRLCRVVESSTQTDTQWAGLSPVCSAALSGTATSDVSTRYTYDAAGNLASMVDAGGHTTSYAYDAAGRMASRTNGLGDTAVFVFDALGRQVNETHYGTPPQATRVSWTYDNAGRPLTRTADGTSTSYAYDARGNKTCAGTGATCATAPDRITSTYDRLNRALSVDDNADGSNDTVYSYSPTSPSWTDPTGTYLVTLDVFDRATAIDDPVNASNFTWTYRADGQLASSGQPNGNTTTLAYDALGRLASKHTTGTGQVNRAIYDWTHNAAGSILSEQTEVTGDPTNDTRGFAYDPLGRLTTSADGAAPTAYGWDAALNRTSVQPSGGLSVPTTYDAANRPGNQNGVANAFTSDADGRLTARPNADGTAYQRLEWDSLGRLTKVKGPSGNQAIATYSYDPLDRLRLVDYGANNRVRFRYLGLTASAVQTIDDQSGSVMRNVGNGWTGDHLEDWAPGGAGLRVYGTNSHGDVTWTAGPSGSVSGTIRYDPYGNATSMTGTVPDFRFQGSWADDTTKLSWVVTRWYAPAQGAFISEDSLLGEPRDPDSRHLYAYGEGDPVDRIDPNGQYWYVSRAGDTLASIARKRMPTSGLWGAVFNSNRGLTTTKSWLPKPQQVVPSSIVGPGHCMWLPWSLFSSRPSPGSDRRCTSLSKPAVYNRYVLFNSSKGPTNWALQARIAIEEMADVFRIPYDFGNGFFNIAPPAMRTLTALVTTRTGTTRSRDTEVTSNVYLANGLARRFLDGTLATKPGVRVPSPIGHVQEWCGNSQLPQSLDSGAAAFTLGEYIFWTTATCPDGSSTMNAREILTTRSHEYVHVMEYQELGSLSMLDYVNQSIILHYGGSAWNYYEAPAYLWTAWTWIYGETSWSYFHAAG